MAELNLYGRSLWLETPVQRKEAIVERTKGLAVFPLAFLGNLRKSTAYGEYPNAP